MARQPDGDGVRSKQERAADRSIALTKLLSHNYSNLYSFLMYRSSFKPIKLGIIFKRPKEVIIVATAWDGLDASRFVCFGSGADLESALAGLNAAIGAGKWRPDLYASGP